MRDWIAAYLPEGLPPLAADLILRLAGIGLILLLGIVAHFVLVRVLGRLARYQSLIGRFSDESPAEAEKRVKTVLGLVRNTSLVVLWAVVLLMLISELGIDITPILAGAGIVGLAVGFGAQSIVRDLISGVFHILENHVRVGDVVQVNGVGGVVERVTYRVIVLRDLAQNVHVFPHGSVTTLCNMTKTWSAAVLDIGVAYKENTDRVVEVLRRVAAELAADAEWSERILEPLEVLGVDAFADSAVMIRVRFRTKPIEQWSVAREYRRRLKFEFDRLGIEIPFPHRTLYVAPGSAPVAIRPASEAEAAEAATMAAEGDGEPAGE